MNFEQQIALGARPLNCLSPQIVLVVIGQLVRVTRHEMRSILMRNGVILNFLGFLKVIGPIVSVSSVQP